MRRHAVTIAGALFGEIGFATVRTLFDSRAIALQIPTDLFPMLLHEFILRSFARSFCSQISLVVIFGLVLIIGQSIAVAQETAETKADAQPVTEFQYPLDVVATKDGTIYVADLKLPGIWKVKDGKKSIYFQASKKFKTPLNRIRCLALDHEGRLLAGCTSTRDVFRFDDKDQPVSLMPGPLPGIPMSIAVAADGTIYVADTELHRIWKTPSAGSDKPEEVAVINSPRGLALDDDGNLWVLSVSSSQGQIQKVTPDGKVESFVKGHPFNFPHNIVRTSDGSFFVTDNYDHCVWMIDAEGNKKRLKQGAPLDRPVGMCLAGENLLIADPHIKTIFQMTPAGDLTTVISSPVEAPKK